MAASLAGHDWYAVLSPLIIIITQYLQYLYMKMNKERAQKDNARREQKIDRVATTLNGTMLRQKATTATALRAVATLTRKSLELKPGDVELQKACSVADAAAEEAEKELREAILNGEQTDSKPVDLGHGGAHI